VLTAVTIDDSAGTVAIEDSDVYGMVQSDVDKTMDMIKASNVRAVRLFIPWAGAEALHGQLDWTSIDKTATPPRPEIWQSSAS
jgi:hypothetical protein